MVRLYLLVILMLLFQTGPTEAQITSVSSGAWSTTTTWDLGRIPVTADSVVVATTVSVDADLEMQALTVLSTGTLLGVAGENKVLSIVASLLNQGNITQSATGDDFRLFVAGDIVNEGMFNVRKLWFTGATDQNLSQTSGASWLSSVYNNKTGGRLVAGSALDFGGDFTLIASSNRTLVMNGFDLIVSGGGTISYATIDTNGRLVGRTDSSPFARNVTFTRPVTIVETVRLASEVVFDSLVTVTGTLTRDVTSNNTATIVFRQDILNQGTIEDEHPDRGKLRLRISGDLRNEGIWSASETEFRGDQDQTLFLDAGKKWSGGFRWEKDGGAVIAATDQVFGGSTRIDSLIMGGFDLAVSGAGNIRNSSVYGPGSILSLDGNEEFATDSQIIGNTVITGRLSAGFEMTIVGDLIIEGTLESLRGGSTRTTTILTVDGSLTNQGTITNGANGAVLSLRVSGNVTNQGTWSSGPLELINQGSRTVWVPGIEALVYCGQRFASAKTGSILFSGDNAMPDLSVTGERTCAVLFGATLALDDAPSSSLQNIGSITVSLASANGLTNREFYKARVSVDAGVSDTVSVTHFGDQVPTSFGNAVPGWWRIRSSATTGNLNEVTLLYDSSTLTSGDESLLEVFHSNDEGRTWEQISTSANLTRESWAGRIILSNAPLSGDLVLSVHENPTVASSILHVSVVGRSQVRLGNAPNRFTIVYSNLGDNPVGISTISIRAPRYHHIVEIQPSGLPSGDTQVIGPADFMPPFEEVGGIAPDSIAILLVESLAPGESRSFTVVFTTDVGASSLVDPVFTATILSPAPPFAHATHEFISESAIADEEWDVLGLSWPSNERPLTPFLESLLDRPDTITKSSVPIVLLLSWARLIVPMAYAAYCEANKLQIRLDRRLAERFEFNRTVKPKFQIPPVQDSVFDFVNVLVEHYTGYRCEDIVSSFDPNEKVGPSGFGNEGFVTSLGRSTYQIFFENLADASAPAYEIFIDDTLSTFFDASTVRFEAASHEGWEFSASGQTLSWHITGIELPPNANPPEGEGWVQFSVEALPGLTSGTSLENRATIVFDVNEPILTNTVVNTLDILAPTTTMVALASSLPAYSVVVSWTSLDGENGSGVSITSVFGSMDGGPFAQMGTSDSDSLVVAVEPGHEYSFYALSRDAVGNAERERPAVVTTRVVSPVATQNEELPFLFSLEANYPNPFNPVTTIQYSLPTRGTVSLDVYDVTGRLVARLVRGEMPAGIHSVAWDARQVGSGVYFYRLVHGDQIKTRPMVFLK